MLNIHFLFLIVIKFHERTVGLFTQTYSPANGKQLSFWQFLDMIRVFRVSESENLFESESGWSNELSVKTSVQPEVRQPHQKAAGAPKIERGMSSRRPGQLFRTTTVVCGVWLQHVNTSPGQKTPQQSKRSLFFPWYQTKHLYSPVDT